VSVPTRKRRWFTICAITASAALVAIPAGAAPGGDSSPFGARALAQLAAERGQSVGTVSPKAKAEDDGGGDDGNEADEIAEGADQYAEARTSPGIVAPGAYGAAWTSLTNLPAPAAVGAHHEPAVQLRRPALPRHRLQLLRRRRPGDRPDHRPGRRRRRLRVRGRGQRRRVALAHRRRPLAAHLRRAALAVHRRPALDGKGRLWYATGEANTSATSFVGTGVYVLSTRGTAASPPADRVGGTELESTIIRKLRFGGDTVWAATSRGAWTHSLTNLHGPWKLEFAPNPAYLPGGASRTATRTRRTRTSSTTSRSTRRTRRR
jgi:hypothetical protein